MHYGYGVYVSREEKYMKWQKIITLMDAQDHILQRLEQSESQRHLGAGLSWTLIRCASTL